MNLSHEPWVSLQQRVQTLYNQPPRAYHNWPHVESCLRELAAVRTQCQDAPALELAIWFHDGVYDVHRHDNEPD